MKELMKEFKKILAKKGKYVIGDNTKYDEVIDKLLCKGVIEFSSRYDDTVRLV